MKALTLLQPWAGLVALGIKEFETRSRNSHYRGEFVVHSSAKMTKEGKELLSWLSQNMDGFKPGNYKYKVCTCLGSVLGKVELKETFSTDIDYVKRKHITSQEERFGDFSKGRYFWKLDNPELFVNHFPAKGKLNFWEWKKPHVAQCEVCGQQYVGHVGSTACCGARAFII